MEASTTVVRREAMVDPVGIRGPMTSYKGCVQTTVSASVCVDCGDVQLRANGLDKLQQPYVALQGDPALRLNL